MRCSNSNPDRCLIVGVGASAGGLPALRGLLGQLPTDAPAAFIVVQHLYPQHASVLAELLAKSTALPVEQIRDGTRVASGRVYVIPPNSTLTICNHVLKVHTPREDSFPINCFLESLAADQGAYAVCILLSGEGTDGTIGLRAIKEHGGMAMAQTLESAHNDPLLRSAIATGLVDSILPPEEMWARLQGYKTHLLTRAEGPGLLQAPQLTSIHDLLFRRSGHDFSLYKESTLLRRLERRMNLAHAHTGEQYIALLQREPAEIDALVRDLLVGVTEFFRDPDSFDYLSRYVIPQLFAGKASDDEVRAWVVGCASGEEAYSLAILLHEHQLTLSSPPKIRVFATDIDELRLARARRAAYPESIRDKVSADRLERFFTHTHGSYQVRREIREQCVFANHNVLQDAPFSRLDLIACRNVMIYLQADLQRKITPMFHFALRPEGFLFMGTAENVIGNRRYFWPVHSRYSVFRRTDVPSRLRVPIIVPPRNSTNPADLGRKPAMDLQQTTQRYQPACIVVSEAGEMISITGPAERYLDGQAGMLPGGNVFDAFTPSLRASLRVLLRRTVQSRERSAALNIGVLEAGGESRIHAVIEPVDVDGGERVYMLVLQEPVTGTTPATQIPPPLAGKGNHADHDGQDVVARLQGDLRSSQEQLQVAVEELSASQEHLRAVREEYQSSKEELEASREELQSYNEELQTLNCELNGKVTELDQAHNDIKNLLDSTRIATVFLTRDLRIRSFTPSAQRLFPLATSDIGRPITDLAALFEAPWLVDEIAAVLESESERHRDVRTSGDAQFRLAMLPYHANSSEVDGIVLTFNDVTELQETRQKAEQARVYAEDIVNTIRESLLVLDQDLRVVSANDAFYRSFGLRPEAAAGSLLWNVSNGMWDSPALRELLCDLLPSNTAMEDFLVKFESKEGGGRSFLLNARRVDHLELILLAMEDVTERQHTADKLREANARLTNFSYAMSHDLQEPLRMTISFSQLLARDYGSQLDVRANQYIEYAVQGAMQMESLLKGLREYWAAQNCASDDAAATEVRFTDANRAVADAIRLLSLSVAERGAVVNYDHLPTVAFDEISLTLLFQNLISNAIKYSREGEPPRIDISAERSGDAWRFAVRDNGIGIEAEYLEVIFQPFKRLHGPEIPGTGLGLTNARSLVDACGGTLMVESIHGQGSTFYFTIPEPKVSA